MTDRDTLIVTGASGTVGTALLRQLLPLWSGAVIAIGRRSPALSVTEFIRADLSDLGDLSAACERIRAIPATSSRAVILAAGIESRASIATLDSTDIEGCFRINTTSQLCLLSAAVEARTSMRVVAISSDVVGKPTPDTVVYGASKAALEDGIRHATADFSDNSLTALFVRLPYIGVPMGQLTRKVADSEPLANAVTSITEFLTSAASGRKIRTWPYA